MRCQNNDASRYIASREGLCPELGEVEKCHEGIFLAGCQRTPSAACQPGFFAGRRVLVHVVGRQWLESQAKLDKDERPHVEQTICPRATHRGGKFFVPGGARDGGSLPGKFERTQRWPRRAGVQSESTPLTGLLADVKSASQVKQATDGLITVTVRQRSFLGAQVVGVQSVAIQRASRRCGLGAWSARRGRSGRDHRR